VWGWWGEDGFFDVGALPAGHEAGKVFRVCEEGEDQLRRVGEPLRRFKVVGHRDWGGIKLHFSGEWSRRERSSVARYPTLFAKDAKRVGHPELG